MKEKVPYNFFFKYEKKKKSIKSRPGSLKG